MPANEKTVEPSTIENIDTGLYEWVRDLELSTTTNDGFKPVPVLWLGTERAFQIKNNKEIRKILTGKTANENYKITIKTNCQRRA